MSGPVLFWTQHLLGSGHLRRAAAVARALADRGVETVVVSGGPPLANLALGGARLVQLPPVRAADAAFSGLVDETGRAAGDDLMARRRARLEALAAELRPAVVATETFPFGRRRFRREVAALLDAAAGLDRRPTVVCSVRDILQRPKDPSRHRAMLEIALARYDRILVHGDERLVRFADSFPPAAALGDRVTHTGYVAGPVEPVGDANGPGAGEVVVSAGGGAVGSGLFAAAWRARRLSKRAGGSTWRLLVGESAAGRADGDGEEGVVVEPNRTDFRSVLARCAVSVSQGGYNTVADLFAARARTVIAPYAGEGETEQTERAERLAARGAAVLLREEALSPETLARAVDRAMDLPRLSPDDLDLGGARRSAALLAGWADRG